MSEDKKSLIDLVPNSVDNAVKNITDKPTQNIGTTFADIWYLVFGGISQAAEKKKLKYSYALQEFEKELQEKISKIPEDKLIEPDTQIVAKALEESKYCIEKDELREMFSNLISNSMNLDYSDTIHPLYINIIKSLTAFDAKLLLNFYYCKFHDEIDFSQTTKIITSIEVLSQLGLILYNPPLSNAFIQTEIIMNYPRKANIIVDSDLLPVKELSKIKDIAFIDANSKIGERLLHTNKASDREKFVNKIYFSKLGLAFIKTCT